MYGHGVSVESGGTTLRGSTLHPPCEIVCCLAGARELTPGQARLAAAVHASGHAAVGRAQGMPAPALRLESGAACADCGARPQLVPRRGRGGRPVELPGLLVSLAAGVQAELLWLERAGLFTGTRAWCAEAAGLDDQEQARHAAARAGVELAYERPGDAPWPWNYRLQELRAVRLLDERWPAVTRLAEALDAAGDLSAVETARLLSWGC
ncbi:hypothetical protein [Streptacidiphilus monticola]|uniref:Uncharacterized protein n=1 Tax=Streptacidiphilus monticola TaxID=2161674 RepID=A0ABW1G6H0_9ACTN